MGITVEHATIVGAPLGADSPFPLFGVRDQDATVLHDESFLPEDTVGFGENIAFRVLPYRMQESYGRERRDLTIKTIVLENEYLRATFFPEYGGRLASLIDKEKGRECLFCNSVFQPANLAIRNAWFSGGIEWNIGRFGHTALTCSPLFFARVVGCEGEEFLRAYEYERTQRLFFSIDFHLPAKSRELGVYVRIVNDSDEAAPAYWWTNIAIREHERLRIFSGAESVLYIKPESNRPGGGPHAFARADMPALPSLPGRDASYPHSFTHSSEYFFQTPDTEAAPWEAAGYEDGFMFFERSTPRLRYRKLFCWGTHPGGRHWCDYLSCPSEGNYVEIQAGLAPTQVHGSEIPAKTTWDFTQAFGAFEVVPGTLHGEWGRARDAVRHAVDHRLSVCEIAERHAAYRGDADREPAEILHDGSGWGALEGCRRRRVGDRRPLPGGLSFPADSLGDEQTPWLRLLDTGKVPPPRDRRVPQSYMVDPAWLPLIEQAVEQDCCEPWALVHLGIALMELGREQAALAAWQDSVTIEPTSLAWRNIAVVLERWGDAEGAIEALRTAGAMDGSSPDKHLAGELIHGLNRHGLHQEVVRYYAALPKAIRNDEKIAVTAAISAAECGDEEPLLRIVKRPLAHIKEGETRLVEAWHRMHARRAASERGCRVDARLLQETRVAHPPPSTIDFSMA